MSLSHFSCYQELVSWKVAALTPGEGGGFGDKGWKGLEEDVGEVEGEFIRVCAHREGCDGCDMEGITVRVI